jgi:LmbE family N-acetylglucosaminyl deacetylase
MPFIGSDQDSEAVLAVGAHPVDVETGCGGILMRHLARGDKVAVLTLTGAAAGPLGAELWHHDLAPTELGDGSISVPLIEAAIEEIGATTVYTHTLNDADPEHRHVHRATMLATRHVPRIYCYQTSSASADFRPTRFAAITEFIDGSQARIRSSGFGQMRHAEPLEIARERTHVETHFAGQVAH